MRLRFYNIIPELQPYIKLICSMDCDEDADRTHIRVLPDTCVELFVNYTSTPIARIGKELHQRSIITFRMSRPMDVQMRKGSGCLAVCFYPGMAYRFFQVPMHILADTTVLLSDLWKNMATEIEESLGSICDGEVRADVLQKYLLLQLTRGKCDLQVEYCLHQVKLSGGLMPVSKLTGDAGLSQRHLSRKFQQCIGLSPKEYLRVYRFIQSLEHLKNRNLSFTEIACKSGYYDQAHFNRDYRNYTGHTPGEVVQASHILY